MKSNIYQSEVIYLNALRNLFIEMTAKNCNQHCKHCYIDFPKYKKETDFISIDVIKQALNDTTLDNIECIYLTGAEPMTHPDFNAILRLCLKRSNVCICTNGSFINDKSLEDTRLELQHKIPSYEVMVQELAVWMQKHPWLYAQYLRS